MKTLVGLALLAVAAGNASAAQPGGVPVNVSPPTISGSPQVGQSLTADRGSWTGRKPLTYSYTWRSCDASGSACADLAGATGPVYALSSVDAGRAIRVVVTARNRLGQTLATSAATAPVGGLPNPPPPPSGGLHVVGNELRDAANNRVFLHGVNYSGAEYACIQGWGIFDGPSDDAMISAMRSWNVNVVHLGLNEDCILGINGVPAAYAGANYMNAIVAFVDKLHAHGVYAEVSVMWAAPGTQQATGHPAILDQDHSADALRAIANAFKGDPNTMIGLQSEPHNIGWGLLALRRLVVLGRLRRARDAGRARRRARHGRDERRHRVRDRLGEQPHPVAGLQAERSSEPTRSRGARVRLQHLRLDVVLRLADGSRRGGRAPCLRRGGRYLVRFDLHLAVLRLDGSPRLG